MPVAKLTKSVVDQMPPGTILWDTVVKGFGARRQLQGVHYVLKVNNRWHSLGRHGSPWTTEAARREAQRLLGQVLNGNDPKDKRSDAFADAVEAFLTRQEQRLRPKSYAETKRYLQDLAKPLHRQPLHEITRREIAVVLGDCERRSGPTSRNRFRSALSSFWSWAIAEGLCETSPINGTTKSEERPRERVLSKKEIATIWKATAKPTSFSAAVRLLLLTAQRRTEIGSLRWSEIDWDERLIRLSPERTKNKREHLVPLSEPALAILRSLSQSGAHRANDGFVLSPAGFSNWARAKGSFDAELGIADYRLHDFRRSAATIMADQLGVLPHIIEAILNHVSGHKAGVAGIYNRAKYAGEMRDALGRWADYVEDL